MLYGFCAPPTGDALQKLHEALWSVDPPPVIASLGLPRTIPPRLASYLKTYERAENGCDDQNDDLSENGSDANSDDDGTQIDKPPAPPIFYLKTSPDTVFRVYTLADATAPSTLLVRDEYLEFLADVDKDRGQPPKPVRYFLTGQPGIGKWPLCALGLALMCCRQELRRLLLPIPSPRFRPAGILRQGRDRRHVLRSGRLRGP
ncbi:hypothetical protein B0H12DRAFT_89790 [Mycena haematopus]|nr:hypothetical protein B0H12DRAFT_89790 [Mycena haematopus]